MGKANGRYLYLCLCFVVLMFSALWHWQAQAEQTELVDAAQKPLHLTQAQLLLVPGFGYAPPPYEADGSSLQGAWQAVVLPHAVVRNLTPQSSTGNVSGLPATVVSWYQIQVPAHALAATTQQRYLYIPRWKSDGQIAVYADGRLLFQSHAGVRWNGWNIPLWIALNSATDAVPPRSVLLRIERPQDSGGGISSLWIGDSSTLSWRYQVRNFLQVQLPFSGGAAFLAVGLFSLFLWLRMPKESTYLMFFVLSAASFLRTLHYIVGENTLLISEAWFSWLTINSLCWMVLILHFFVNYLHGISIVWMNRLVIGITVLMGVATLPMLAHTLDAYALSPLTYIALLAIGSLVAGQGIRQSRQARSRDGLLLSAWAAMGMGLGGYDWLLQNNYLDSENIYLGPYSNIGVFLIFMHIIFRRYMAANDGVRQANAVLKDQLQIRESQLQKTYQRLKEAAHIQTLSQERQRLMQDMHDGMGSSLLTALLSVEKGRIGAPAVAEVLRSCIDDLKLAIDSMEPVQANLLLLLATLRFRLEPRLTSANIKLLWEVENVPLLQWLDPRNALHILRILQEAFANIIKHTQSTEIRMATCTEGDCVLVMVTDNGQGFSPDATLQSKGKGLANQRRRAASIGAQIRWVSSESGTRMTLHLPVERLPVGQP